LAKKGKIHLWVLVQEKARGGERDANDRKKQGKASIHKEPDRVEKERSKKKEGKFGWKTKWNEEGG